MEDAGNYEQVIGLLRKNTGRLVHWEYRDVLGVDEYEVDLYFADSQPDSIWDYHSVNKLLHYLEGIAKWKITQFGCQGCMAQEAHLKNQRR